MATMYGYARCSTDETRQDIERQIRELMAMGIAREHIYLEYESGTKIDRTEWIKLIHAAQPGDTIATLEVSRISRSVRHLLDILDFIAERKLRLVIANSITIDCTNASNIDPMSKAFLQMAGVFAELERNIIAARVKSGMAKAASEGRTPGRPKTNAETIPRVFYRYYPQYKNGDLNISELAKLCSLSRVSVYKYLHLLEQ
jgi:DNA invertase Pin-like site-specific DNA recombinase